jgi:hypothetical protein
MKPFAVAASVCLALALAAPAGAQIANSGFESGDLTSWSASGGPVDAVSTTPDYYQLVQYVPTEGRYFGRVTAGEDGYTTLSQLFTLGVASVVAFDAAFLAFDDTDHNDDAYVRIYNALTNAVVFQSNVQAVDNFGRSDWMRFSQVLDLGDYTFEAGVRNIDGPEVDYSSQLLLDNVTVTATAAAIPEPAGWALMVGGFGMVGGLVRRRSAQIA